MAKAKKTLKELANGIRKVVKKVVNKKPNPPQSTAYSKKRDAKEPAKPIGYRFTDKGAKLLGVRANSRPTKAQIAKYKNKSTKSGERYLYQERRIDKGDTSQKEMFAKGGKVKADAFYKEAVAYLKKTYSLDPNDMDVTKESAEEAQQSGDTAKEYIDRLADKYDLDKTDGTYAKGGSTAKPLNKKIRIHDRGEDEFLVEFTDIDGTGKSYGATRKLNGAYLNSLLEKKQKEDFFVGKREFVVKSDYDFKKILMNGEKVQGLPDKGYDANPSYGEGGSTESDPRVEEMLPHYVAAALFSSSDYDTDEPLERNYGFEDVDTKTLDYFRKIIAKFLNENKEAIAESGLSDEQVAHDLWLTQNHHGAGFFDHSLDDDVEKKLIESAHALGDVDLEVGDDGKIHAIQAYGDGGDVPSQSDVYGRGGSTSVELPHCNLFLYGFEMDLHGNQIVDLGYPNQRSFSIQTNGSLPETHRIAKSGQKISELTAGELEMISREARAYISEYGSAKQKEGLKIYKSGQGDMFADGGQVEDANVGRTVYDSDSNRFRIMGRTHSREGKHNGYTLRGEAGEKEIATSDLKYFTSAPLEKEKEPEYEDRDAVREIELFAENDQHLYRSSWVPILHNLKKKLDKGTFNLELAAKLMKYHVERADKEYNKQYGDRNAKGFMLSVKDRKLWAHELAKEVQNEYGANKLEGYATGGYISNDGKYVPGTPDTYKRHISLGKIAYNGTRKINEVSVEIEIRNRETARDWDTLEELHDVPEISISGNIWNAKKSDRVYSGQMLDDLYKYLPGSLKSKFKKLLVIWREYHNNDIKPGTIRQDQALEAADLNGGHGKPYDYDKAVEHLKLIGLYDDNGYKYGHGHLYQPVPESVLAEIREVADSFPEFSEYAEGGQIEAPITMHEAEPSDNLSFKLGGGLPTIANFEANQYAEHRQPFKGSHLEGKTLDNGDYVVLSYGHYPIWYYSAKEDRWYANADKVSNSTSRHLTQSRPDWNAPKLSHTELVKKMFENHAHYDLGGVMVKDLEQGPVEDSNVAHGGDANLSM